ncbi:hypothetical protein SAMN02910369_01358 [Lachnospiraceae bacterium NE2001]|nr:hypothetical protein SAMN02910369_01358 [Lachnospiraceae bacterium NE2001]
MEKTSSNELAETEKTLTKVLKPFVDDLIKLKYVKEKDNYSLMIIKKINNKETTIDFSNESNGIKELVSLLPYVIRAMNGENVILDEYANHIHDVISILFLETIFPYIHGQIILSTHNSILLNQLSDQFIESFYFVKVMDSLRSIDCITDIEPRIRKEYNYQKKYISDDIYLKYRNNARHGTKESSLVNTQKELMKLISTNTQK